MRIVCMEKKRNFEKKLFNFLLLPSYLLYYYFYLPKLVHFISGKPEIKCTLSWTFSRAFSIKCKKALYLFLLYYYFYRAFFHILIYPKQVCTLSDDKYFKILILSSLQLKAPQILYDWAMWRQPPILSVYFSTELTFILGL